MSSPIVINLNAVEQARLREAQNGPWRYRLSEIYFTAEVTTAVHHLKTQAKASA